jgi:hypothetical protein
VATKSTTAPKKKGDETPAKKSGRVRRPKKTEES